jgi:hypothetical protein
MCSVDDDISISGEDLSELPGLHIFAERTPSLVSKFELVHVRKDYGLSSSKGV